MWPFGAKAKKAERELSGTEKAEQRTHAEWMEHLRRAKVRLRLAETEADAAPKPGIGLRDIDIIDDLRAHKAVWRRREYYWLLTSALRHGVLDRERYDEVTGELPFSSLGWL